MYRKKNAEEIPEEETTIWYCNQAGCKFWMRDNFSFEYAPICRECHSPMIRGVRILPPLVNTNGDLKSLKKGVRIL